MNIEQESQLRLDLNKQLTVEDSFFESFGGLDNQVYADGVIPKKYKELTGLSISIVSHCKECILYHIQECIKANASKEEMMEAIKMGVIGGGSVTYPMARYCMQVFNELGI